jgi:hypothetical protein
MRVDHLRDWQLAGENRDRSADQGSRIGANIWLATYGKALGLHV